MQTFLIVFLVYKQTPEPPAVETVGCYVHVGRIFVNLGGLAFQFLQRTWLSLVAAAGSSKRSQTEFVHFVLELWCLG